MSAEKRACILIELEPGREQGFGESLTEMVETGKAEGCLTPTCVIKKVDFVYGAFDIVMILEGDAKEFENIIYQLRALPHIRRTETLLCFEKVIWEDLGARLT